jgi:hypothetical protein
VTALECPAEHCQRRCGGRILRVAEQPWWVCTCEPCDCGACLQRRQLARTVKTPLPGARGRPVQLTFAQAWAEADAA